MRTVQAFLVIILMLGMCSLGYAGELPGTMSEAASKTAADDRLPILQQEKWQLFVSPYMWIAGANINTNIAGRTTSIDVPWWDIAGKLFRYYKEHFKKDYFVENIED